MDFPLISLVVLAYNHFEQTTAPCLESLKPWFEDPELEFIVFDNASPDGSAELARAWCAQHPSIRYIAHERNLGYAGGMNAGATLARGNWLFLVNNDTEFPALAIEALKITLRSAPERTAMIAPVTNSAGNGQRYFDPLRDKAQWLQWGAWIHAHPVGELWPTYRCDFFCIAIRREVYELLGGLDTVFGMGYFEDFDFSLRLRAAGYDQAITEDVFIYHQGSATFQKNSTLAGLMRNNKKIMQARHPSIQFNHVRQENRLLLQHQLDKMDMWPTDAPETAHLKQRVAMRQNALLLDLPKSILKRWLWKLKTRDLTRRIIVDSEG